MLVYKLIVYLVITHFENRRFSLRLEKWLQNEVTNGDHLLSVLIREVPDQYHLQHSDPEAPNYMKL